MGFSDLDIISRSNIRAFSFSNGVISDDGIGELYDAGIYDDMDKLLGYFGGVGVGMDSGVNSGMGGVMGGGMFSVVDSGMGGVSNNVRGIDILGSGVVGSEVGSSEVGDVVGVGSDMSYGEIPEVRYGVG